MAQTFKIPFNGKLSGISLDVHEEIYWLLKRRNPKAEFFAQEPELMKLYLSYILIRDKKLDFAELDDGPKNEIQVEISIDPGNSLPTPLDPKAKGLSP